MKVGILGSGVVGRTLAGTIALLGHKVAIGTRDVAASMAATGTGPMTPQTFADWAREHPDVVVASFPEASAGAEIVFNATNGAGSLDALRAAGAPNLAGKILIDLSNPLDFSAGFPPSLTVANTDSLAEQIQRAFPEAKVVKTLNTVNAFVMVDPGSVAGGEHHLFVSGNDAGAKEEVTTILKEWFGWRHVIDLGDITTARGPEMYLPLWVRLMGSLGTPMFNVCIAR